LQPAGRLQATDFVEDGERGRNDVKIQVIEDRLGADAALFQGNAIGPIGKGELPMLMAVTPGFGVKTIVEQGDGIAAGVNEGDGKAPLDAVDNLGAFFRKAVQPRSRRRRRCVGKACGSPADAKDAVAFGEIGRPACAEAAARPGA